MGIFDDVDRAGDEHRMERELNARARFDRLAGLPVPSAHTEAPAVEMSPFEAKHAAGRPDGCDPDVHAAWFRHADLLKKGSGKPPVTFRGDEARTFVAALYEDLLAQGWTLEDLDLDSIYADAVAEAAFYRAVEDDSADDGVI